MSYLQLATFVQEEELDSDDEVDLSKFMPKSERKVWLHVLSHDSNHMAHIIGHISLPWFSGPSQIVQPEKGKNH